MGQNIQEWIKKNILKAALHKFYLVHSSILCLILKFIGSVCKAIYNILAPLFLKMQIVKKQIRILQLRRILQCLHLLTLTIVFCTLSWEWEVGRISDGGLFQNSDIYTKLEIKTLGLPPLPELLLGKES